VADIYANKTGDKFIFNSQSQKFVPATPEQVQVGGAGLVGQAASLFQGATGIPGLISPTMGEALNTVNPATSNIGFGASMLTGAGILKGASRQGAGRTIAQGGEATMAERIAVQVEASATKSAPGGPPQNPLLQQVSRELGDSAGAARLDMDALPDDQRPSLFRWIADEFTDPSPLLKEQREALKTGNEIGFNWLPGQADGNNLLVAGVKSHPILRGAFDSTLQANRAEIDQAWLRAIGSDALEFSRDAFGVRIAEIGDAFDSFAGQVGSAKISGALSKNINDIVKLEPDLDFLLKEAGLVDLSAELTGKQIMALRSRLNSMSNQLWNGTTANPLRAERIDGMIDQLDDVIAKKVSKESLRNLKAIRSQWRNVKLLESTNSIDSLGGINPLAIDKKLRSGSRTGSKPYQRNSADFPGLDPATAKAYKWTRVASLFADNIGDSGTATRSYLQRLMNGEFKGVAQTLLLKQYLEREAVKKINPKSAALVERIEIEAAQ
tara:strand:- start:1124 stop:2611 length:1488 start_codon:yes stop_codon:yes gene_type:complete